jgi:hypothetical protein
LLLGGRAGIMSGMRARYFLLVKDLTRSFSGQNLPEYV